MNETLLMNGFNCEHNLGHVEPRDGYRKDLILDKHGHEISPRQELHQHVEKCVVLKRRMQLHNPRIIGIGKNITLGTNMGQLILFEHFRFDK